MADIYDLTVYNAAKCNLTGNIKTIEDLAGNLTVQSNLTGNIKTIEDLAGNLAAQSVIPSALLLLVIHFPTLSVKPSVKKFSQNLLFDPVHRARMASGAILTRPTFSQTPDEYGVSYSLMPDTDKIILETWVKDKIGNGGLRFEWTNIQNGKTYISILLKPIAYKIHPRSKGDFWKVDIRIAAIYEAL